MCYCLAPVQPVEKVAIQVREYLDEDRLSEVRKFHGRVSANKLVIFRLFKLITFVCIILRIWVRLVEEEHLVGRVDVLYFGLVRDFHLNLRGVLLHLVFLNHISNYLSI